MQQDFKCYDDSPLNNGSGEYKDSIEVMIMGNDGVWKTINEIPQEEKKERCIKAIQESLSRTVENNGNMATVNNVS